MREGEGEEPRRCGPCTPCTCRAERARDRSAAAAPDHSAAQPTRSFGSGRPGFEQNNKPRGSPVPDTRPTRCEARARRLAPQRRLGGRRRRLGACLLRCRREQLGLVPGEMLAPCVLRWRVAAHAAAARHTTRTAGELEGPPHRRIPRRSAAARRDAAVRGKRAVHVGRPTVWPVPLRRDFAQRPKGAQVGRRGFPR